MRSLYSVTASTVTRSHSSRTPSGCGGTWESHHRCKANKSAGFGWCYYVNMDRNLLGMLHKELRQFCKQRLVQPRASKVYLMSGWSGWSFILPGSIHFLTDQSGSVHLMHIFLYFTYKGHEYKGKKRPGSENYRAERSSVSEMHRQSSKSMFGGLEKNLCMHFSVSCFQFSLRKGTKTAETSPGLTLAQSIHTSVSAIQTCRNRSFALHRWDFCLRAIWGFIEGFTYLSPVWTMIYDAVTVAL